MLALLAVMAASGLAAPATANAIPGLVAVSKASEFNSEPRKVVSVGCPGDVGDKVVVGGGAEIEDGGRNVVRLTSVMPHRTRVIVNYLGAYSAAAEAPGLARFPWSLRVHAVCANDFNLVDYQLRDAIVHNGASTTFDHVEAVCPEGTVAYGAGAQVWAVDADGGILPTGELGLQLIRTSGPLDIARATARESASGYHGPWRLRSRVICARRKTLFKVPFGPVFLEDRGLHADGLIGTTSVADNRCPAGFFTHGIGGGAGGGTTDAGPVWLRGLRPHPGLRGMTAAITGGVVVAHQTCAR